MNDKLTKGLQDATKDIELEGYVVSKDGCIPFGSIGSSFEKAGKTSAQVTTIFTTP